MAEAKLPVVYMLLASSVVMLAMAAVVWMQIIDIGTDPAPVTALLVLAAVADIAFAVLFLRRITSR